MQITDSLAAGGAERVSVNLANLLPRDRFRSFLCTTRCDGPLSEFVAADVGRLRLDRKHRWDLGALRRLAGFIHLENIQILHAHASSLFVANLAKLLRPSVQIVWHDHFGRYAVEKRPAWLYRLLTRRVAAVISVNQPLVDWARNELGMHRDRVWYVPNFACVPVQSSAPESVPGQRGQRLVCVANLRPEKDHLTLLAALSRVKDALPDAHLLLIGSTDNQPHVERIRQEIAARSLECWVTILGPQKDVAAWLRACDIGVLSSASEGLPLSLLEYGLAGLAVVATDVGQCAEVLDHGACGLVVPTRAPEALAEALVLLLQSEGRRRELASSFQRRVDEAYSAASAIRQLTHIYERVMQAPSAVAA
ncbi:MAG: glycosyltransferase [Pirellulaceae bacterium]